MPLKQISLSCLLAFAGTTLLGCFDKSLAIDANPDRFTTVQELEGRALQTDENVRIFPGAEGFGTLSKGGRGGRVCIVTNTNAEGSGSLRDCAESKGPRVVVFNTGGTIEVERPIVIDDPYISIYGQTATGDGILIKGSTDAGESPFSIRSHDVLVQHLRLRPGTAYHETCCRDAARVGWKEPSVVYNVVLDHNSMSWGTDQIASTWYDVHNVTFSYNIISESLHDNGSNKGGPAGRGLLLGSEGAHSLSIHHNLFAHSYQRNPLLVTSGTVDVVNNLVFHWVSRGGQQESRFEGQKVNWVGNRYIGLDNSQTKFGQGSAYSWGDILLTETEVPIEGTAYFYDNLGKNRKWAWQDEWAIANTDYLERYDPKLGYHTSARFPAEPVSTVPAKSLEKLLPGVVGAVFPKRDSVDKRIVKELAERRGFMPNCIEPDEAVSDNRCRLNVGGWPTMEAGEVRMDTDGDGLPDDWESANGLSPEKADSQDDVDGDGYTNLEAWIFGL
ncbi:MAG: hypothetical protein AB8B64_20310 [Granulosicoccus sp.]